MTNHGTQVQVEQVGQVGRIALVEDTPMDGIVSAEAAARYAWTAMAQAADFISRTALPDGVAIALWDEPDDDDPPMWAVVASEGDGVIDATCGAVDCHPWLADGCFATIEEAIAAAPKTAEEARLRLAEEMVDYYQGRRGTDAGEAGYRHWSRQQAAAAEEMGQADALREAGLMQAYPDADAATEAWARDERMHGDQVTA